MHETMRNVNGAYDTMIRTILKNGIREESRNGPVFVYPEPVMVTYERPMERVLFSHARKANPFFHLFEAFWMLHGSRDARWLDTYVKDFSLRYAESDGTMHGAYGHRWRNWLYGGAQMFDQIEWAVDHLLRDPGSRRAVIQMYNPELDSIPHGRHTPRDIPCNTTIYLRLIPGKERARVENGGTVYIDRGDPSLDLTVCCRSNDAIWGAYGANAVHFSILQEYLAWRLDARVGRMHQLSNNLHLYESTQTNWDPIESDYDHYASGRVAPHSLFASADSVTFHSDLLVWIGDPTRADYQYSSGVFTNLLVPMARAHAACRQCDYGMAFSIARRVRHMDWSLAALQWIQQKQDRSNASPAAVYI